MRLDGTISAVVTGGASIPSSGRATTATLADGIGLIRQTECLVRLHVHRKNDARAGGPYGCRDCQMSDQRADER